MSASETTGTAATVAAGGGSGSLILSQPIVIDNGTATIKSGFAGSSKPKVRTFCHEYIYILIIPCKTYRGTIFCIICIGRFRNEGWPGKAYADNAWWGIGIIK